MRVVTAIKDLQNKQAGIAVETANKNVVQNGHRLNNIHENLNLSKNLN